MEVNIIFENVKAYNVDKFDVKLGQEFSIELIDAPGLVRWFSDNDAVLQIDAQEDGAKSLIKSTKIGKSEIQLQVDGALVKTLYVETYDSVAISLNPKPKEPVLK